MENMAIGARTNILNIAKINKIYGRDMCTHMYSIISKKKSSLHCSCTGSKPTYFLLFLQKLTTAAQLCRLRNIKLQIELKLVGAKEVK